MVNVFLSLFKGFLPNVSIFVARLFYHGTVGSYISILLIIVDWKEFRTELKHITSYDSWRTMTVHEQ